MGPPANLERVGADDVTPGLSSVAARHRGRLANEIVLVHSLDSSRVAHKREGGEMSDQLIGFYAIELLGFVLGVLVGYAWHGRGGKHGG